jgi:hypothetical protein
MNLDWNTTLDYMDVGFENVYYSHHDGNLGTSLVSITHPGTSYSQTKNQWAPLQEGSTSAYPGAARLANPGTVWQRITVAWVGRARMVELASETAVWYHISICGW